MGNQTVYAGIALGCMAAAIVAGGFAPVTPGDIAPYCKAGAAVFTGLAALFMHPPGWQSDAVAAAPASTAEKSNAAH